MQSETGLVSGPLNVHCGVLGCTRLE